MTPLFQKILYSPSDFDTSGSRKKGITLLLVIVILSAILSISLGIFSITLGEIKISGEIGNSFHAFYAADQGIERMLYRDRVLLDPLVIDGLVEEKSISSGARFRVNVTKPGVACGGEAQYIGTGDFPYANPERQVKRAFFVCF